jgi:hypothetical protein
LDPGLSDEVEKIIYKGKTPPKIGDLDGLVQELELLTDANRLTPFTSTGSGGPLLDPDDLALLGFLKPTTGAGAKMIQRYKAYHDPKAGNFIEEIIKEMNDGLTVILDLGNADDEIMQYFSEELASAVLFHQVDKFTENKLGDHYMQLYFEEAHNLFPVHDEATVDIYRRLAKEGAKYHIGMVYSTQSVTTINRDLLAQTENFFIAHMSSQDETNTLAKVNVAFENMKDDILRAKTPGYMRMLTRSNRSDHRKKGLGGEYALSCWVQTAW